MATKQIIERRAFSQGPDFDLPEEDTHFLLGCGACEHSIRLLVRGENRAKALESEFKNISPRWVTRQGMTVSDANTICPENPAHCANADRLEEVSRQIDLLQCIINDTPITD